MAVNGIEIEVGQKWRTRDGRIVSVKYDAKDNQPFETDVRTWHFPNGQMYEYECDGDLVELIFDPTEQPQPKEQTYTEEQIRKAGNNIGYTQTIEQIISELKKSTDPDYVMYLKLKEKFEND